ncbi:MAG: DUF2190 family protein [Pseudomonadota bacterium]
MAQGHIQHGYTMDYVNDSTNDIASGDVVVIGEIVGIAITDIGAGDTGAVATEDVWEIVKASDAITQGALVYWDDEGDPVDGVEGTGAITTTATDNMLAGIAWTNAEATDGVVHVKLNACIIVNITEATESDG